MNAALAKLQQATARTGSLLSVGLEPCPEYLFPGMTGGILGYKAFLRMIIAATGDRVAAFKVNVAFFEALGKDGTELLYSIRDAMPDNVLLIADAKRSDIASSSQRYATSLYDRLRFDSVTVNPLMGRDSVEPFLAYRDKLTWFLCLTSNPGAADFLKRNDLYREIARAAAEWNAHGQCGLVVGATRPDEFQRLRADAPALPFLVPGIGAQGGRIGEVLANGRITGEGAPGLLLHVTRGVLPRENDTGDPVEIIRRKVDDLNKQIAIALNTQ